MMKIDENYILLILGGLDNKLHLYYFSLKYFNEKKTNIFQFLVSLKGYDNAITDISSRKWISK